MKALWSKLMPFWKFQIGGWAVYSLVSIPVKWALFGSFTGAVVSFYRELIGLLLTFGMYLVYRRIYGHWRVSWILFTAFGLSFAGSAIEIIISIALHNVVIFEEAGFSNDATRMGVLYYRAAVFAGWSFLYFMFRLISESQDLRQRLAEALAHYRETELQMLRAQMNPHLLANAMTGILASIGHRMPKVTAMVQSLANYLNYSLIHQKDDFVTMDEEYRALGDYLTLKKTLLGEKLDVGCQIEESTRPLKVPGVTLQPLVENAVKYGFRTWAPPVVVRLAVSRAESDLVIEVANTGRWVNPDRNRTIGGIGLQNLRRRLHWLYENQDKIEILEEEGWVTIRILLPIK